MTLSKRYKIYLIVGVSALIVLLLSLARTSSLPGANQQFISRDSDSISTPLTEREQSINKVIEHEVVNQTESIDEIDTISLDNIVENDPKPLRFDSTNMIFDSMQAKLRAAMIESQTQEKLMEISKFELEKLKNIQEQQSMLANGFSIKDSASQRIMTAAPNPALGMDTVITKSPRKKTTTFDRVKLRGLANGDTALIMVRDSYLNVAVGDVYSNIQVEAIGNNSITIHNIRGGQTRTLKLDQIEAPFQQPEIKLISKLENENTQVMGL